MYYTFRTLMVLDKVVTQVVHINGVVVAFKIREMSVTISPLKKKRERKKREIKI